MKSSIRNIGIILILVMLLSSCGASKHKKHSPVKSSTEKDDTTTSITETKDLDSAKKEVSSTNTQKTEAYIEKYAATAIKEMRDHKIPASITLAQGILESNSGNSSLTRVSNNHFGIKCHKNWQGSKTYYDDDKKGECFRVYKEPAGSFDDHSEFLSNRKRYAPLFKLDPRDYKAWAKGLRAAGYATDKRYPQKLITIIEKYKLYKYDEQVLGKKKIIKEKKPKYYIVKKGDALFGISKRFNMSVAELKAINSLESDTIEIGQKLWLQKNTKLIKELQVTQDTIPPKKTIVNTELQDSIKVPVVIDTTAVTIQKEKPQKTPDFHIVKKGETLYSIAYKYDLEVPDLRKWNHIKKNEITIGQKVLLKNPFVIANKIPKEAGHVVVKGETLYSIATKYHLSVARIKTLNGIKDNTIYIGQVLKIK